MSETTGQQPEPAIDIQLSNDLREIARVAAHIDAFCSQWEIPAETAYAVNLAVDELLNNTICHGYEDDEPHRIMALLRCEEHCLVVIVVDDARSFDPTHAPEPQITLDAEEPTLGGLGLLLVNRMMDGVDWRRRAGCNVTTLTKSIATSDTAKPSAEH